MGLVETYDREGRSFSPLYTPPLVENLTGKVIWNLKINRSFIWKIFQMSKCPNARLYVCFATSLGCKQPGSSRQGRDPAGESPAVTIVRFSHVAMPQLGKVTIRALRGV